MNKSLTQNKKKEGGKMGYFTDCGLLVLLSFLRLFYRLHICHWFTVDDLDFLKRGGRISPTIAWIGGKLKIKPVLRIAEDGTLAIPEKVRGSKAAMNTIVSKYESSGLNEEHPYVFLCHGDALEQAEKAKAAILEAVPGAQVTIMPMSPIIGIHTGPGVQAVIYFGNNR